jgi:hypothetical protein
MIAHLILTIPGTDWEIPWAGIGTFLLGLGSALSGYAAIKTATNVINKSNTEDNTDA